MEQHLFPGQVLPPLRAPHLPLVLTLLGADVLAGGAAEVDVGRTDVATVVTRAEETGGAGALEDMGADEPQVPKTD